MIIRNATKKQVSNDTLPEFGIRFGSEGNKTHININGELAQEDADKYAIGVATGIWCDCWEPGMDEELPGNFPCQICMQTDKEWMEEIKLKQNL